MVTVSESRRQARIRGTAPAREGGVMCELVAEAYRLINAASAAIVASKKEPPSDCSAVLARIIVSEGKKQCPTDALIQSIDLEENILDWNDISAAMNVIVKALG
jgi:hypothetical protein